MFELFIEMSEKEKIEKRSFQDKILGVNGGNYEKYGFFMIKM